MHAEFLEMRGSEANRLRLTLIVLSICAKKESGKNAESNCQLDHVTSSILPPVICGCRPDLSDERASLLFASPLPFLFTARYHYYLTLQLLLVYGTAIQLVYSYRG